MRVTLLRRKSQNRPGDEEGSGGVDLEVWKTLRCLGKKSLEGKSKKKVDRKEKILPKKGPTGERAGKRGKGHRGAKSLGKSLKWGMRQ